MKLISFRLSMPNVGSWDRKWTSAQKQFYIVKRVSDEVASKILSTGSYRYDFGDGWTACISVELIKGDEAAKRRKISAGFAGYGWMVESILTNNKIIIKKT